MNGGAPATGPTPPGPTGEAPDARSDRSSSLASRPSIPDHTLLHSIGAGSYGEVWLARSALGTFRAVKIVRRAAFDHDRPYEREFAGLQKFEPLSRTHEGFVDLLQVGRNDAEGWFYYVMELADAADAASFQLSASVQPGDGGKAAPSPLKTEHFKLETYTPLTLAALVKLHGARPLDECLRLARTLTSALAELHRHGLVHRDIKPSNIIFVDGVPKLADVGLVAAAKGIGQDRSFVGTEGFIPPEGPGTPAADLYSLGIVLYMLGTGQSHRDFPEPPADLATRPDRERWLEFSAVVHRATHHEPKQRYASAKAMLADLERLQCGESVKAHHSRQNRLRAGGRIGLVVAVLTTATTGMVLLWQTMAFRGASSLASARDDGAAGARNPKAAQAYRLGLPGLRRGTTEGFRQALENFTAATDADPQFAAAYARLFELHLMSEDHGIAIIDGKTERLNQLSAQLLKVAPASAETHAARAIVLFLNEWKWAEAEREFQQALALDSQCRLALTYYGYLLTRLGRAGEARPMLERALQLDPTSPLITKFLGHCEFVARRYEKALPLYQRASELEPSYPSGHYWAGRAYLALTNHSQALDEFVQHELNQGFFRSKTEHRYKTFREALEEGGPNGYWMKRIEMAGDDELWVRTPYWYAERYARLGEKASALTWLEKALAQHDSMEHLQADEFWDSFRDEPKFREILRAVGLDSGRN